MAQWLRDNPWRQGHLLTQDCASSLGLVSPKSPGIPTAVMVISHDCDLAQDKDAEPHCEVIVGCIVSAQDGNLSNAKSPRRLHLSLSQSGNAAFIELEARAKTSIAKDLLASHKPDPDFVLSYDDATILRAWLAARYGRSSFADGFERRITQAPGKFYDKVLKIFKPSSDEIMAVYFDVDDGEEVNRDGPDDVYELVVTLLYSTDKDPAKAEATATRIAQDLKNLFRSQFFTDKGWQNVELVDVEVMAETAMTVQASRLMKRWNLDYISLREGNPLPS